MAINNPLDDHASYDGASHGAAFDPELEFVAYLDGETDAETSRQVEALLSKDQLARLRLRSLERTWDALDELPRTHVSDNFACTTVEMIAVREQEELYNGAKTRPRRSRNRRLMLVCLALASGSIAFAVASKQTNRKNELLLKHLPVIERLDEYRQIEDIDLLRRLKAEKIFTPEASDGQPGE